MGLRVVGSGNQRRKRKRSAKQAQAASRQAQAQQRSANSAKAPSRGGAEFAARQHEILTAQPAPWWERLWPRKSATIVGVVLVAASVGTAAIVQADDFLTVARRLGLPAIILAIVLVLAVALRGVLVPKPSRWFVVSSTIVWTVGAIAFTAALWLANEQATQTAVPGARFDEEHGIDVEGQSIVGKRFDDVDLAMSNMRDAVITQSGFSGADLSESDFRGTKFEEVDFSLARLCAVDARGADLSGAINLIDVADWSFFVYDATTQFPEGFDIELQSGPVKVENGTRNSFVFSCSGGPNRVLRLEATS